MTAEPGRTYRYDAENRIKSVNNGSVATYQYDGNGRRAVKNSASGTRIYFYDIEGRPVAESGPTGVWLSGHAYFQNRHAFENTGSQLLWRHPDHLGTAVVRTNTDGNKICDSRFYPYGEEFTPPCAGDPYKFTGKERDAETGLDYFGARHYGSYLGRFVSVDPIHMSPLRLTDPQRLNLFAYVRNNPLRYNDPEGEDFIDTIAKYRPRAAASFIAGILVDQYVIPRLPEGKARGRMIQAIAVADVADSVPFIVFGTASAGAALTGGLGTGVSTAVFTLAAVGSYGAATLIIWEADAKWRRGSAEVRSYELLEHYSVGNLIFSAGWVETFEQADEHFKNIRDEIKTQFALPGSSPLAEAESLHNAAIAETLIKKRLREEE